MNFSCRFLLAVQFLSTSGLIFLFLTVLSYPSSPPPGIFLHSTHLQLKPQATPSLKHSQYFFKQFDFLQLHPLLCVIPFSIFELNAEGCLQRIFSIVSLRSC